MKKKTNFATKHFENNARIEFSLFIKMIDHNYFVNSLNLRTVENILKYFLCIISFSQCGKHRKRNCLCLCNVKNLTSQISNFTKLKTVLQNN